MEAFSVEAIAEVERRAYRALYQDGIDELRDGASGLLFALGLSAPAGYRLALWSVVGLALFGLYRGLATAKRRLTDRRTGFVRPAGGPGLPKRIYWWLGGGAAFLTAIFAVIEDAEKVSLPTFSELWPYTLLIGGFLWRARATRFARYYLLAVVPFLAAVVSWPIGDDLWADIALLCAITGAASLFSGSIALLTYLRATTQQNPA